VADGSQVQPCRRMQDLDADDPPVRIEVDVQPIRERHRLCDIRSLGGKIEVRRVCTIVQLDLHVEMITR